MREQKNKICIQCKQTCKQYTGMIIIKCPNFISKIKKVEKEVDLNGKTITK